MWVYVERLQNGTWANSGSINVDMIELKQYLEDKIVRVAKPGLSQPFRSYFKGSKFKALACVVNKDLPEEFGVIMRKDFMYRVVWIVPLKTEEQ